MKVSRATAVAFLVAIGFANAATWTTDKITDRLRQVPAKVKTEEVPDGQRELYEAMVKAGADSISIDGAEQTPDLEAMDMAALRSFVEENKVKVKVSDMKTETLLRAAIKKAMKGPKPTKTDKAVDKAAKDKKAAAAPKGKPEGKAGKAKKEDRNGEDEPEERKSNREVDAFGCSVGSVRSMVNQVLTKEWQTDVEIAEAAGVDIKQARSRLRRATRKGLFEKQSFIQYRLAPAAKK